MNIQIPRDIESLNIDHLDRRVLATFRKRPKISHQALCAALDASDPDVRNSMWRLTVSNLLEECDISGHRAFKVTVDKRHPGANGYSPKVLHSDPENPPPREKEIPPGLSPAEISHWKTMRFAQTLFSLHERMVEMKGNFTAIYKGIGMSEDSPLNNCLPIHANHAAEYSRVAKQIRADTDLLKEDQAMLIEAAEAPRNFYALAAYLREQFPRELAAGMLPLLGRATVEQLAQWYNSIQNGQFRGISPARATQAPGLSTLFNKVAMDAKPPPPAPETPPAQPSARKKAPKKILKPPTRT